MAQIFEGRLAFAHYVEKGERRYDFSPEVIAGHVYCGINLAEEFELWRTHLLADGPTGELPADYIDAHCSVFTPASFELLVRDCAYLGLISFVPIEVTAQGFEFHAHLQCREGSESMRPPDYAETRTRLLRRIRDEEAETSEVLQATRQAPAPAREASM